MNETTFQKAWQLERAGDISGALQLYESESDTSLTASFGCARCLTKLNRLLEAKGYFERLSNSTSKSARAEAALGIGLCDLRQGHYHDAVVSLLSCKKDSDGENDITAIGADYFLGCAYWRLKRKSEAASSFLAAWTHAKDNVKYWRSALRALTATYRFRDAWHVFRHYPSR